MEKRLFTSESVTEGHPDKICDQISDAVLDALYEQDPYSRVACETLTNTGFVMVMGEITTKASIDIPQIVRDTVVEIGYDSSEKGFDGNTCAVMVALDMQNHSIFCCHKYLFIKANHFIQCWCRCVKNPFLSIVKSNFFHKL